MIAFWGHGCTAGGTVALNGVDSSCKHCLFSLPAMPRNNPEGKSASAVMNDGMVLGLSVVLIPMNSVCGADVK